MITFCGYHLNFYNNIVSSIENSNSFNLQLTNSIKDGQFQGIVT